MITLFKDRNFNDYINDTFDFFKTEGKHFFKIYFVVNGGLLLIVAVLLYFIAKGSVEYVTSMATAQNTIVGNDPFTAYLENNFGSFIAFSILGTLLILFISVMLFIFPVLYLDLYDKNKGAHFTAKDILTNLKLKVFKIFKFCIGTIFIIFPLIFIVFIINIVLCLILIGFPLLIITFSTIIAFFHLSFYYYINSEESFFSALSDARDTIKQQFWPIVLSTLVFTVLYYIISIVFSLIPYFFGIATTFTSLESTDVASQTSAVGIITTMVFIVSTILNYIINNFFLIQQGLIYYSHIENERSKDTTYEIDLIGSDNE